MSSVEPSCGTCEEDALLCWFGRTAKITDGNDTTKDAVPRQETGVPTSSLGEESNDDDNKKDDKYVTPYPIAWHGREGWSSVHQRDDGVVYDENDEEEGTDDFVQKIADGIEREKKQRGTTSSSLRKMSPIELLLLLLCVLTLLCATAETLPERFVSFLMSGDMVSNRLVRTAESQKNFMNLLQKSDGIKKFWDTIFAPSAGEVAVHLLSGVVTVWVLAIVHLNRTRALLTLSIMSTASAHVMGTYIRRAGAVNKIAGFVSRARRFLADVPALRSFNAIIPSATTVANGLTGLMFFLTAFIIPCTGYLLSRSYFPSSTRWIFDDLSGKTLFTMILSSTVLAYVFYSVRNPVKIPPSKYDRRTGEFSPAYSTDDMLTSLIASWTVVICLFLITRHVSPRNKEIDTRHMFETYRLNGVLPNFRSERDDT